MNQISSFGKDLAIHCGGLTARRATVEPIDDFTEHQTASGLVKAAVADIPGDLDRPRMDARTRDANRGIGRSPRPS
ncbi:MAG: hypothetical protein ACLQFI_13010 [Methylocella sp.]